MPGLRSKVPILSQLPTDSILDRLARAAAFRAWILRSMNHDEVRAYLAERHVSAREQVVFGDCRRDLAVSRSPRTPANAAKSAASHELRRSDAWQVRTLFVMSHWWRSINAGASDGRNSLCCFTL